jgi:hypothetical protein
MMRSWFGSGSPSLAGVCDKQVTESGRGNTVVKAANTTSAFGGNPAVAQGVDGREASSGAECDPAGVEIDQV